MTKLDADHRNALPAQKFAYVDGKGGEHLPIHDATHVKNAAARFDQTDFETAAARHTAARHIVAAAHAHGVELAEGDAVVRAAKAK